MVYIPRHLSLEEKAIELNNLEEMLANKEEYLIGREADVIRRERQVTRLERVLEVGLPQCD